MISPISSYVPSGARLPSVPQGCGCSPSVRTASPDSVGGGGDPAPARGAAAPAASGAANGGDGFQFSGASLSYLHIQAQLTLERTVYDQSGKALQSTSLSLNFERTELLLRRYSGAAASPGSATSGAGASDGAPAAGGPGRFDPLQALRDYFSPERTSNRILRFATDGFRQGRFSGGSGPDARGDFRDFILPYIEKAVDDALAAFGNRLPDGVKDEVHKTLDLIRKGLQRFADGGEAVAAADGAPDDAKPGASAPKPDARAA